MGHTGAYSSFCGGPTLCRTQGLAALASLTVVQKIDLKVTCYNAYLIHELVLCTNEQVKKNIFSNGTIEHVRTNKRPQNCGVGKRTGEKMNGELQKINRANAINNLSLQVRYLAHIRVTVFLLKLFSPNLTPSCIGLGCAKCKFLTHPRSVQGGIVTGILASSDLTRNLC